MKKSPGEIVTEIIDWIVEVQGANTAPSVSECFRAISQTLDLAKVLRYSNGYFNANLRLIDSLGLLYRRVDWSWDAFMTACKVTNDEYLY